MSIAIGRFVTGGQCSSQMRAVSLSQLMIDVLRFGDPRITLRRLTLPKLPSTMGTYMSVDGCTDLHVLARGAITEAIHRSDILEPIVRSYAGAIGDAFILMQGGVDAHLLVEALYSP